jgi:chitinase
VVVEPLDAENRPPVAHAGSDQTVKQGARVRLDAVLSGDPEGKNPFYYWSQVKGMPVILVEPLSLRPYFFAPVVTVPRLLRFRLIVKDEEGAESFPAYVNVTVMP